jgi:hypothetical protein
VNGRGPACIAYPSVESTKCLGSWGRSIHLKTCSRVPSTLALKRPTRRQASRSPLVPFPNRQGSKLSRKERRFLLRPKSPPFLQVPPSTHPLAVCLAIRFNSILSQTSPFFLPSSSTLFPEGVQLFVELLPALLAAANLSRGQLSFIFFHCDVAL